MSNPPFNPGIWSSEIERVYRKQSFLGSAAGSKPLEPNDVWAPTGETFEDPVAWGKLLGVRIMKPGSIGPMGEQLVLLHPKSYPYSIPLCSPTEVTRAVKSFATLCDALPEKDDTGAAQGGVRVGP